MSRTFAIGDIHGAHLALKQCLRRSGFNRKKDTLITIGDICDGWPYVYECVEILRDLNTINLIGNHDDWFKTWLQTGIHPDYWNQGGKGTAKSYLRNAGKDEEEYREFFVTTQNGRYKKCYEFNLNFADIPPAHRKFFESQHLYYKDDKNRLFVHGGMYDRLKSLKENQESNPSDFYWDRRTWLKAMAAEVGAGKMKWGEEFSEIYIGHTSTTNWFTKEIKTESGIIIPKGQPITIPMRADIVWNLDTGAGSIGCLTIMDVDTKEFWQSDPVNSIYGDYNPRG